MSPDFAMMVCNYIYAFKIILRGNNRLLIPGMRYA